MTRVASKYGRRQRSQIDLHEDMRTFLRPRTAGGESPVDREAGFIKDVRILGLESVNKRRYLSEAAAKAKPLYEGLKVKINHPLKPGETRPVQSVFGWLEGIYQAGDGALFAKKLHYLKSHEMAESVCEAAERNPALFSLSHNATGSGFTDKDGTFVVEEITEARSVDIVDEGATNKSLFEQREREIAKKQLPGKKGSAERKEAIRKALLEMGYDMEATDVTQATDGGDGEEELDHLFQAFKAMKAKDPEKANKILAMLKQEIEGDGEGEETEEETEIQPGTGSDEGGVKKGGKKDDGEKKAEEGRKRRASTDPAVKELQEELQSMKLEKWLREQCEARDILLDATLLESLTSLADRKKITAHLDWLKGKMVKSKTSAPRSGGPRPIPEGRNGTPKDAKEFASSLLN